MLFWDQSIEILRESIFAYAQMCHGNLGFGILIVSFLARLALAPLAIRLAKAGQIHQRALQRIQPQLEAVRKKHKGDSRKVAEETQRIMANEGVSVAPAGLLGSVAQLPLVLALYSAVRQAAAIGGRFYWILDIAKPNLLLTAVVMCVTMVATASTTTTSASNQTFALLLSGIVTFLFLSKVAAGVALDRGLSGIFSAAQGMLVQRGIRSSAA